MGKSSRRIQSVQNTRSPERQFTKRTSVVDIPLFTDSLKTALMNAGHSTLQQLWKAYQEPKGQEAIQRLLEQHVRISRPSGKRKRSVPDYTTIGTIKRFLATRRMPTTILPPPLYEQEPSAPASIASAAE